MFKVGDRVRVKNHKNYSNMNWASILKIGSEHTVLRVDKDEFKDYFYITNTGFDRLYHYKNFELVSESSSELETWHKLFPHLKSVVKMAMKMEQ
jgi:hypothetical protein